MRRNTNRSLHKEDHNLEASTLWRDQRNLDVKENEAVKNDDDVTFEDDNTSMDDDFQSNEKNDGHNEREDVLEKKDCPIEDVGPNTPRPLYGEDRSENMGCEHVFSDDEDEGVTFETFDGKKGTVDQRELDVGRTEECTKTRNPEDVAMHDCEGEWEDEEDDKVWETRRNLQFRSGWFCINCTMSNIEGSRCCRVCGEHRKSGILKLGFLAPAHSPAEVPDVTAVERKKDASQGGIKKASTSAPLLSPIPICSSPPLGKLTALGYDVSQGGFKKVSTSAPLLSPLPISSSPPLGKLTALGYDERMLLHSEVHMKSHPHPERPDRLRSILAGLAASGLFPGCCFTIPSREATRAELELVHTRTHVSAVEATSFREFSYFTSDTYANKNSALAARLAAGISADLAIAIMRGQAQNGFALVRPPGHHAEESAVMGFCLHNNAAVAAKAALSAGAKKILIVDWDVHHGNGTQEIFEHDPFVLYISLHRYEGGQFYPGTGAACEVGSGEGEGFSVNIPWGCEGIGDEDYTFAFQQIVLPIATQFAPDITIISAGFDAARGDPLGGCEVTPLGYAHMAHMLSSVAQGRMLVVLEGGYNLRSISASAAAVVKVLLGDSPGPIPNSLQPSQAGLAAVLEVIQIQSRYWKGLHLTV